MDSVKTLLMGLTRLSSFDPSIIDDTIIRCDKCYKKCIECISCRSYPCKLCTTCGPRNGFYCLGFINVIIKINDKIYFSRYPNMPQLLRLPWLSRDTIKKIMINDNYTYYHKIQGKYFTYRAIEINYIPEELDETKLHSENLNDKRLVFTHEDLLKQLDYMKYVCF